MTRVRLNFSQFIRFKLFAFLSIFDPQSGNLVYVYRDKKDKLKKAVLDPEVVDDKNRTLRNTQQLIEEAKEKKDYASMSLLIDFYMSELDGKFNTLAKTQGKTDSKLFME